MKKFGLAVAMMMVMASFLFVNTAFAGRVKHRQIRQQKRIHQGVVSGELTRHETRRLEREQIHLQHAKRKAWSDGQLTRRERVRLEIGQDRASRDIYRAKHNDRTR